MFHKFCKAKIAKGRVTKTELNYEGSLGMDSSILECANIYPYEMVLVINLTNGNRFETYVIPEKSGTGTIGVYGGAARLCKVDDELIILAFAYLDKNELQSFKGPKVIKLTQGNKLQL